MLFYVILCDLFYVCKISCWFRFLFRVGYYWVLVSFVVHLGGLQCLLGVVKLTHITCFDSTVCFVVLLFKDVCFLFSGVLITISITFSLTIRPPLFDLYLYPLFLPLVTVYSHKGNEIAKKSF